jgi:hypothetical protein
MGADRMFRTPFYGRRGTHTMARVNVEDSVFIDGRFMNLVLKLGSPDTAIGALVRAWRLAQEYYLRDDTHGKIPLKTWKQHGMNDALFDVGFARIEDDHVYVSGSESQFAWLNQKSDAGKSLSDKKKRQLELARQNRWSKNQSLNSEVSEKLSEISDSENLNDLNGSEALSHSLTHTPSQDTYAYNAKSDLPGDEPAPEINFVEAKEVMASLTDIKNPDGLVNHWNTELVPKGYPLAPFHLGITYTKKFFYISKLIKESGSSWLKYVGDFEASEFLASKRTGGKPPITWLLEEKNFVDVLAGKYPPEGKQLKERLNNLRLE